MDDRTRSARIDELLSQVSDGDPRAASELADLVHGELHGMASQLMADQKPAHTLQATALVNEAWMKLAGGRMPRGRAHFLRLAASSMRSILVDHARARCAAKRGGGGGRVPLDSAFEAAATQDGSALLALHDALEHLALRDPRAARVAEMRLFGGMEHAEVAEVLGLSPSTVDRLWRVARESLRSVLDLP